MDDIDNTQLDHVRGGLGGLLQAAGPILNGVASIIGAAKSGGGKSSAVAAAAVAGPAPEITPSEDLVSVTVSRG